MTLFSRGFSFDLVTRVWDVLMNEGSYKIVYRVSLGILKYFEQQLLELKFDKIMALLRDLPRHIDANKLMEVKDACVLLFLTIFELCRYVLLIK